MEIKTYVILLFVLIISTLFRIQIINNVLIDSFITEPLFLSDLLGRGTVVPWRIILLLDLCNILLFFILGKKVLSIKAGLLAAFIYGVSPWAAYGQLFGSIYIFLLTFFLIFFVGALMLREKDIKGIPLIITSSAVLLYSSLLNWFILPVLVLAVYKLKIIWPKYLKIPTLVIIILFISIVWLSFKNSLGFRNVFNNQLGFLSNPGIKNTINMFQGESKKEGFVVLAKVSENKYIYLLRYLSLKLIKNIVPTTFFTPQEKLFGFSFSPPIYIGFMIPFFYGLILALGSPMLRKYLFISITLIIPSFFSGTFVDLNRLILFYPITIFLICLGLTRFKLNIFSFRLFLYFAIFLILLQFVITNLDISLREHQRYSQSIRMGSGI